LLTKICLSGIRRSYTAVLSNVSNDHRQRTEHIIAKTKGPEVHYRFPSQANAHPSRKMHTPDKNPRVIVKFYQSLSH
jgi:hypothetical protein